MKLLLIGAGNMGGAMLEGLKEYDITVVESYKPRVEELKKLYPNLKITDTIPNLDGYIVILAIKPQALSKLQVKGKAKGVISILAGTPLEKLKEKISAISYIRAMPNIAALKQKAVISVCGDEELKDISLEILSSIGKCFWLKSEKELDIATGIGGSAPAWIALVAEALSDGAVKLGLSRDISYKYAAYMLEGTAELLKEEHPAILKDKVTSPGGTTAAGAAKLEEGKVRDAFIKAMQACYDKTQNLN
jgi:pyrroline-5-carboxylate reductase